MQKNIGKNSRKNNQPVLAKGAVIASDLARKGVAVSQAKG